MGDVQLRPISSHAKIGYKRVVEAWKYMNEELNSALWVNAEYTRPGKRIKNHVRITFYTYLVHILEETQEGVVSQCKVLVNNSK